MGSFSIAHWLIVIVVLLLIFGPKRLSEVGKGLGQGIRNFKKGLDGSEQEKPEVEGEAEDQAPKQLKPGSKKTADQKRAEREAD